MVRFNLHALEFAESLDIFHLFCGSPAKLVEVSKKRFESVGGEVLEFTGLTKVDVFDDAAVSLNSLSY